MSESTGFEIAIIGMAGHFPGADDPAVFWLNLKSARESITRFTEEEVLAEGHDRSLIDDPAYVPAGAFLDGKEFFDAPFFGYTPAEAKLMDPQLRLFHEQCWKALEDGGYAAPTKRQKTGLFAGATPNNNWENYALLANRNGEVDAYTAVQLRSVAYLCSLISYRLNLQGPSIFLNTACSTSLVAVQRACMSLLLRECDMALAGGVTVNNYSKQGYRHQEGMILSADGHCRPFDSEATGTVGGEGAGVVLLKRLSEAVRDRDHIHAVIRGSAVNNDGDQKISFTAPSVEGQSRAIIKALNMARVEPRTIGYVETHGTATRLGDPIEIAALRQAFGQSETPWCAIGSVKSNIGHLDAAAGVAGLIKAALSLHHRQLAPSLHFSRPNPAIDFNASPFYVNNRLQDWPAAAHPRRAGVSSFGIGGTNAHVILEEAPPAPVSAPGRSYKLLPLSAKTPAALQQNRDNLLRYLSTKADVSIDDISYTLQTGRASFAYRDAIVCRDREDAIRLLSVPKAVKEPVPDRLRPRVVFLFTGQGSQYVNMFRGLYEEEPFFRQLADECFALVRSIDGRDLRSVLFADAEERINQTANTQPLLFIVEYALARLLMSWGIRPDSMIGHSLGEYVAATISGVFTMEDALRLVVKRGALMQSAEPGAMLGVSLPEAALEPLLAGHPGLSLAAVNSTAQCVVSGTYGDVAAFREELESLGHPCRVLRTSHAFHSSMMDALLEPFAEEVSRVKIAPQQIPFISNRTGLPAKDAELATPEYWAAQLREAVRFAPGLDHLLRQDDTVFIEVGPGRTLGSFVTAHEHRRECHKVISTIRHPQQEGSDLFYLLTALGQAWQYGLQPDWEAVHGAPRNKISLPTYAFDRVAYPVLVNAYKMVEELTIDRDEVKASSIDQWFYAPSWKLAPHAGGRKRAHGTILLLAAPGLGTELAAQLRTQGHRVISVQAGDRFEGGGETYTIRADGAGVFERLLEHISAQGEPAMVIHGWGLDDTLSPALCYESLLHLAQAISQKGGVDQLCLLTRDVHPVWAASPAVAGNAVAPALLRVIGQELPFLSTAHIDLDGAAQATGAYVEILAKEVLLNEKGKTISFRQSARWAPVWDKLPAATNDTAFREGGAYLITGGLGRLGLLLARYLLDTYHARLVLVGRKPIDTVSEQLAQLSSHQDQYLYVSADVADPASLSAAIAAGEARFGPLNGVLHAAGVPGQSVKPLSALTPADFHNQLRAKLDGIAALRQALDGRSLDFCLSTSSLSALLGGIGFGAYAAANAAMDTFINDLSLPGWRAVNLDGLGFAAGDAEAIGPRDLPLVIETALRFTGVAQLAVSPTNLNRRLEKWVTTEPDATTGTTTPEAATGAGLEDQLLPLWRAFFGKPALTIDDDFFDAGGDSLKALTMIGRIHRELHRSISIRDFFQYPTVRSLAAYFNAKEETAHDGYQAIPAAPARPHYALSAAQKRLYFLHRLDPSSLAYNLSQAFRLRGPLDRQAMQQACTKLLAHHEILRTSFIMANDEPVQVIAPQAALEIEYFASGDPAAIIRGFIRPFHLEAAPLLRVGLIRLDADDHVLVVDMHHIISDGVSQGLMIADFMRFYTGQELAPETIQYKDYAEWQQSAAQQDLVGRQKQYWLDRFAQRPSPLDLPLDRVRPAVKRMEGAVVNFSFTPEETAALKALADAEGSTLYMVLLSLYALFLSRLSGQKDIVIGTPTAGRQHAGLEKMMGMFVNTLPLRNEVNGEGSFRELLNEVKGNTLSAFAHQDYQYEDLIDELNLPRDTSRNPLFDALFVFQNYESVALRLPGLEVEPYNRDYTVSLFDLSLTAMEQEGSLHLYFDYPVDLFEPATVARFAHYFKNLSAAAIAAVEQPLQALGLITPEEASAQAAALNRTAIDRPAGETVVSIWRRSAEAYRSYTALRIADRSISYEELDERCRRVAANVQRLAGERPLVGIVMAREEGLIPAIYGILMAGGAYVPIDPKNPAERLRTILSDAGIHLVIGRAAYLSEPLPEGVRLLDLDELESDATEWAPVEIREDDPAYVIYTSGSTGKPKGVVVEHRALANIIRCLDRRFPLRARDCYLLKTAYSFDVSCAEIFGWCLNGGSLSVLPAGAESDPAQIIDTIAAHGVTHINFVPSMFSVFLDAIDGKSRTRLAPLRYLFLAGEALPAELVSRYHSLELGVLMANIYGPTEGTVYSCGCLIDTARAYRTVPIGQPLDNIRLYILDQQGRICPIGIYGELHIAGIGLARGYLNNPTLTEEKFYHHPLLNERLYRTGDSARWLEDGTIEYGGRLDQQVKLRGFRIELGEIEAALTQVNDIREAAASVWGEGSDAVLVAYYVSDTELNAQTVQAQLEKRLPPYMVPQLYVRLEAMPLSAHGKLDRKALPEPVRNTSATYTPPQTDTEKILAALWASILRIDESLIGRESDFFGLGGHSLRATVLVHRTARELGVELDLRQVFTLRTLKALAAGIDGARRTTYTPIPRAATRAHYAATMAQKRLFFLNQLDGQSLAYNQPRIVRVKGPLDKERLFTVFNLLVARHEAFRTSFTLVDGEPAQLIAPHVDFEIEVFRSSENEAPSMIEKLVRPFNLRQAPLLRVALLELGPEDHILLVDTHHIIMDGRSNTILVEEVSALYAGLELPPVELQYKDYAEWKASEAYVQKLTDQEAFWTSEFADGIPMLELPTDFPRPPVKTHEGDLIDFVLDEARTAGLRQMAREEEATLFMLLLALFNILLARLSGQDDIVIGAPVAGREHEDLDRVMGMFVFAHPLRNRPRADLAIREFVREVKATTLAALDNQGYQFEAPPEHHAARPGGRSPLFDVLFIVQNFEGFQATMTDLQFSPYGNPVHEAKFDLTLTAVEADTQIHLNFEYSTRLFRRETIGRFIDYFLRIVDSAIGNPQTAIGAIRLLGPSEQETIFSFNPLPTAIPTLPVTKLFEQQVKATPRHAALVCNGQTFNYYDLNRLANRLVHSLRAQGIGRENRVGLHFTRTPEMIVALLAVLKSGAAYVALDPAYPVQRIATMIEEAGCRCVLTNVPGNELDGLNVPVVRYDEEALAAFPATNLRIRQSPSDLAYIIFTSGSTGRPKGIGIESRSVADYACTFRDHFGINAADRVIQQASLGFDTAVEEIFPALISGATLLLLPNGGLDILQMVATIRNEGATVLSTTPLVLQELNRFAGELSSLRLIVSGGDLLKPAHISQLHGFPIYNTYGPSESTVCVTYGRVTEGSNTANIGRPIRNRTVFILDDNGAPCPLLVKGQICVGGSGLARGYLDEALTKEKFIDHPVLHERLYLTGDAGRWLPDGTIEFLGRLDDQVKIRGVRIEPGEIEAQLTAYPGIDEAVVDVRTHNDDHYLAAYYTSHVEIRTADLRAHLAATLPEYMVPAAFIQLETLPRNANGKLDKKALPALEFTAGADFVAPATDTEQRLARIWSDVLRIDAAAISATASFFEVGGHSLKALELANACFREWGIDFPLVEVFKRRTVQAMAAHIETLRWVKANAEDRPIDKEEIFI